MSATTPATTNNSDELLTVAELATRLKCPESSVYNLTRRRAVRYAHQLKVLRLPMGLRFRKRDVEEWLDKMAQDDERAA
jgi:hypothetical protein